MNTSHFTDWNILTSFLLDEILTGDIATLRNAEIVTCEIQTGDMGTPSNRASVMEKKRKEYFLQKQVTEKIKKLVDNSAQRNTKKSTKYAGTI